MIQPRILLLCAAGLLATSATAAEAQAPLINYQGALPDAGPAPTTSKLSFNLYDFPNGVIPVWGPQQFDNVAVVNGRYDVILGTTDTAGRSLSVVLDGKDKYLGVTVDGREILPRPLILGSAPAGSATSPPPNQQTPAAISAVPPGTIVAYRSGRVPEGWLPCDGSPIPEGEQYGKLRDLIGVAVPDLRGLFLRGIGQNSDAGFRFPGDAARGLGELQQDELKAHSHRFDDYTFS
ncbi:MAG: tail fiber protein, partial [Methylococcaceae bacterium]|nr:tail fiber protein [Methylococcaceae bacterium]